MIHFFRKIRQRLWSQNQFSKYLLYALGEILLVVIGILIALRVNNWNETIKAVKTETLYLTNLTRDLRDQLETSETQIGYENQFYEASLSLLQDYINQDGLILDSAFFVKGTFLCARRTFIVNDPTYTDLISSGNIKFITDDDKKDLIIKYYQYLEQTERIFQNNNNFLVDQAYVPVYNRYGYFSIKALDNYVNKDSKYKISDDLSEQINKLKELSRSVLTERDELELMNAISQRHLVTISNLNNLEELRKKTLALMEALNETS